jgi:hypothetical protein
MSMPMLAHGRTVRRGRTERPVSLTIDELIYAISIVMLDSARRKVPVPALARWLPGLGIAPTLTANVAHGLGDDLAGATVTAWPTVALVGSYELLMMIIRSAAGPPEQSAQSRETHRPAGPDCDPSAPSEAAWRALLPWAVTAGGVRLGRVGRVRRPYG